MSEYQLYLNLGGIRYKVKKPKVYKLTINFYEDNVLNNTITKTYASGTTISPTSIATEYLPTDYEVDSTTPTSDFVINEDTTLSVYYKAQSEENVITWDNNISVIKINATSYESLTSPYYYSEKDVIMASTGSLVGIQVNGSGGQSAYVFLKGKITLTSYTSESADGDMCLFTFYTDTLENCTFTWNTTPILFNEYVAWILGLYVNNYEITTNFISNGELSTLSNISMIETTYYPIKTIKYMEQTKGTGEETVVYTYPTWVNSNYKTLEFVKGATPEGLTNALCINFYSLPFLGTLTKN